MSSFHPRKLHMNRVDIPYYVQTEDRGVVYIGRLPHGFYEDQCKGYFSQFGDITRLRISRNKKVFLISLFYIRLIFLLPRRENVNITALLNSIPPPWLKLWQKLWITISSRDTYSSVSSYLKRKSTRSYGLVQIGNGESSRGTGLFACNIIR